MKKISFIIFNFCFIFCFSQNFLKVEYGFSPNYFKVDNFPTYPTELLIEDGHSVFIIKSTEIESTFIDNVDSNGQIRKILIEPSERNSYLLKNRIEKTVFDEESIYGKKFLISDKPKFEWKISQDTLQKKILGLKCNKATTSFRGRVYDVWFAPEIPISDGPWKFQGLPGLILSVKSQDGEITYEAIEIDSTFKVEQGVYKKYLEKITSKYEGMLLREEFKAKRLKILKNASKSQKSSQANMGADDSISYQVNTIEKDLEFIAD